MDQDEDKYSSTFILTPITNETLTLALEQWDIWRLWEDAYRRGEVVESTLPGLPGQNARYAELEEMIKKLLENTSGSPHRALGIFRPTQEQPSLPEGLYESLKSRGPILPKLVRSGGFRIKPRVAKIV